MVSKLRISSNAVWEISLKSGLARTKCVLFLMNSKQLQIKCIQFVISPKGHRPDPTFIIACLDNTQFYVISLTFDAVCRKSMSYCTLVWSRRYHFSYNSPSSLYRSVLALEACTSLRHNVNQWWHCYHSRSTDDQHHQYKYNCNKKCKGSVSRNRNTLSMAITIIFNLSIK